MRFVSRPGSQISGNGGRASPGARHLVAFVSLVAFASTAWAQLAPIPTAPASATTAAKAQATKPTVAAKAVAKPAASGPQWAELSAAQQQSLQPLFAPWNTLSEGQKRKWIALAQNYPKLPPAEQATLHSRMTEWAALSPQQRAQARLNFADTKKLAPDDKKAKWEAYQSLSPAERQKLAANASSKPVGAAPAVKPVPAQKLASVPKPKTGSADRPRIKVDPAKVDHHTLLPQPVQVAAPGSAPVERQ